jgi:hypothetical protein
MIAGAASPSVIGPSPPELACEAISTYESGSRIVFITVAAQLANAQRPTDLRRIAAMSERIF